MNPDSHAFTGPHTVDLPIDLTCLFHHPNDVATGRMLVRMCVQKLAEAQSNNSSRIVSGFQDLTTVMRLPELAQEPVYLRDSEVQQQQQHLEAQQIATANQAVSQTPSTSKIQSILIALSQFV